MRRPVYRSTSPPIRLAGLLFLLALALVGLPQAPAQAADYDSYYCSGPNGEPLPLNDFVAPGGGLVGHPSNSCGGAGGAFTMSRSQETTFINGDSIQWKLTAPQALSIVGAGGSYNVQGGMLHTAASADGISVCANWPYDGSYPPETRGSGDLANFVFACPDSNGFSEDQTVKMFGSPQASVNAGITCAAPGGQTCTGGPVTINVTRYIARFRDLTTPVATLPIQGDLVAGGTLSGVRSVQAPMKDTGSGVRTVRIYIDGNSVAEAPGRCTAPYTQAVPCPTEATVGAAFDTRTATDGMHQLRIVGVDAAGNEGILWDAPTLIDNGGARGPGSDPAIRGDLNGTPALDDNRIVAWWPGTARAPSKNKTTVKRCKRSAYRAKHALACNGRQPGRSLTADFSRTRDSIIRGTLKTATGSPVSGAAVKLVATAATTGAQPREIATVTTNADGRFEARVPRRDGSSSIVAAWYARSRDTNPVGVTTLRYRVRATTTIGVPARARRGRSVTFRGTLQGTAGQRKGVAVPLQVYYRGRWRTFATPTANEAGKWSVRYRFSRRASSQYRFRARVTPSALYPYVTGQSRTKRVRVR